MAAAADTISSRHVVQTLNKLLAILSRSLPAYLSESHPWVQGADQFYTAMGHLMADQRRYGWQMSEAIVELGGRPDAGRFPTNFTAKNDLSLDFLRHEVVEHQERDVAAIERCVAELDGLPRLHSLAQEIFGNAKGHADILKGLLIVD